MPHYSHEAVSRFGGMNPAVTADDYRAVLIEGDGGVLPSHRARRRFPGPVAGGG